MNNDTDKELKDDIRALSGDMYEMWRRLGQLNSKYRNDTDKASTHSLVAFVISLIRKDFLEINNKISDLNEIINNEDR